MDAHVYVDSDGWQPPYEERHVYPSQEHGCRPKVGGEAGVAEQEGLVGKGEDDEDDLKPVRRGKVGIMGGIFA